MIENENILDDLFRSKLADFEQAPSSNVWAQIQQSQSAMKKKRLFFILRLSGVAAVLLLAFVFGWQSYLGNNAILTPGVIEQQMVDAEENGMEELPEMKIPLLERVDPINEVEEISQVSKSANSLVTEGLVESMSQDDHTASLSRTGENMTVLKPLFILLGEALPAENRLKEFAVINHQNYSLFTESDMLLIEENKKQMDMNEADDSGTSWSVGMVLAPAYSVNQSSHGALYASNMSYAGANNDVKVDGGLTVEYRVGKRWSIQSGIYYNRQGQSSTNQASYKNLSYETAGVADDYFATAVEINAETVEMNSVAGVIEINELPADVQFTNSLEAVNSRSEASLSKATFDQRFEYVELPFIIRYQILDAGFELQVLGGLNAGLLVSNKAYLENDGGRYSVGRTQNMSKFNYSTSMGLGLGYKLNSNLRIRVEPQVKYYLGSLNNNPEVTFKPYSIGIYTGLNYNF